MEVSTFERDLLGLSEFAIRLEKFIEVEQQFVEGSLVLALSSKYGSGKTTFLKMWKYEVENRPDQAKAPLIILLNAWESDYYGDPLFAIISSLVDSIHDSDKSTDSLINAAKDVVRFATAISSQVVKKYTGIDPVAAGKLTESIKAEREETDSVPSDTFSIFQGRKSAMGKLQTAIKNFVNASEQTVLFLVDELDRCRPDYAISYLETIKHIFDVQGAVFILAADRQQLENSAKTAFGSDLDFDEYYRKFVHREVSLPPISDSGYQKLASTYTYHYLEREGTRSCCMEINRHRNDKIVELVAALKLTPRQIQEMFRILGHVFETSEDKKGRLLWCLGVGTIAMAAFKMGNSRIYDQLGSQQFDRKEAFQFLNNLLGDKHGKWWFELFLTGGGLKVEKEESFTEVLKSVGLINKDDDLTRDDTLSYLSRGWNPDGDFSPRFAQIHENIEQISQWI